MRIPRNYQATAFGMLYSHISLRNFSGIVPLQTVKDTGQNIQWGPKGWGFANLVQKFNERNNNFMNFRMSSNLAFSVIQLL